MNSGITEDLNDIWGHANTAYAVGANGTILNWNGIEWNEMSSGVATDLFCVRGLSGGESVFACGANGTVIKYDGAAWNTMTTGLDVNLNGIWAAADDDVYVVGDRVDNQGTVLHWNGIEWISIDTGKNTHYRDVYGFSPDDVFILGDNPTFLHFDGTNWTDFNMTSFPTGPYHRICGTSGNNLYVTGDLLLRFDGTKWTMESSGVAVRDMCLSANNHVFFAGLAGMLMTDGPYPDPCRETGVSLMMPDHVFSAGDTCWCKVTVCNTGGIELKAPPLFVILDVYGSYFFGPGFTRSPDSWIDLHPDFLPGETIIDVIPEFTWPEDTGSVDGLFFYSALTNPGVTEIMGDWDSWEFSWETGSSGFDSGR